MKLRMKTSMFGPSIELRRGMVTDQFDGSAALRLIESGAAEEVDRFPADLPGRRELEAAGVTDIDDLRGRIAEGFDLTSIKGIGAATAKEIAQHLNGQP